MKHSHPINSINHGSRTQQEKDFSDVYWMKQSLSQALFASGIGEVPIGAIAVLNNQVVARAHNQSISKNDPTAHAELLCLRRAASRLQNYRLTDIIMYTTMEPCAMCAGALVWARVKRVVFGCRDAKAGACGSVLDLSRKEKLNHRFEVKGGILEKECRQLVQDFFRRRRPSFSINSKPSFNDQWG